MAKYSDAPPVLRDFLSYHETIKSHSKLTVNEYYLDLRNFLRYVKYIKGNAEDTTPLEEIDIRDMGIDLIGAVTLSDVYDYLSYLSQERPVHANSPATGYGISSTSRARKIATIRSFYKYLVNKANLLEENPVADLDTPKARRSLPRYLGLEDSLKLLESVDGRNSERDYCILTLFLNCGLRISELVGLNLPDVRGEQMRVLGKGNKERMLFLNGACRTAIDDYLSVRKDWQGQPALFITASGNRMSTAAVHKLVKKYLLKAGLDPEKFSAHKLRHTAATLMLQNGVDVRTLQEVLGHEHLNTTQIYTHVDNESMRVAAKANPLGKVRRRGKEIDDI